MTNFINYIALIILLLAPAIIGQSFSSSSSSSATPAIPSCIVPTSNASQPVTNCSINGYDLSPIAGVDLYGLGGGLQYVFRLCGSVSDINCSPGSQLCRFGSTPSTCAASTQTHLFTNASQSFGFISNNSSLGLALTAVGANSFCANGGNMTVNIRLLCGGSVIPNRIDTITTATSAVGVGCQCSTTITITTLLACPAYNNATYSAPVTPTLPSATGVNCHAGQFGIDLSSQFTGDISYRDSSSNIYKINLCQPVRYAPCNKYGIDGAAALACVAPICFNVSATSLLYSYQTPTWSYTNQIDSSAGYSMFSYLPSSTTCGIVVRLVCNVNSSVPVVVSFIQDPSCLYNFFISTSLVCATESSSLALTRPRCSSGCCGLGYDFSSLQYDIFGWDSGNTPYVLHMCGVVNSTSNCRGTMVCQQPTCNSRSPYLVSYFVGQTNTISWSFVNGLDFVQGVRMLAVSGQTCGAYHRASNILFLCDPRAAHPRVMSVAEKSTCVYTATVYTSLVCPSPAYLGGGSNIGVANYTSAGSVSVIDPVYPVRLPGCYFDGYDFSKLTTYDFYTVYDSYVFVSRVCGAVTDPVCNKFSSTSNSSVCQLYTSCGSVSGSYRVSNWNPYLVEWRYPTGNWLDGLQLSVQTGDTCGGDVPRMIRWHFVCDPTAYSIFDTSVVEEAGQSICHYDFTIRTDIVCKAPNSIIYQNVTFSSSSSTGSRRLLSGTGVSGNSAGNSFSLSEFQLIILSIFAVAVPMFT